MRARRRPQRDPDGPENGDPTIGNRSSVTAELTPLAVLLKGRREQLGFSRMRASQLSDVNVNTIESWERGKVAKPPIHDVMRLALVLGIAPGELRSVVVTEPLPAERVGAEEDVDAGLSLGRALAGWAGAWVSGDEDATGDALDAVLERLRGLFDPAAPVAADGGARWTLALPLAQIALAAGCSASAWSTRSAVTAVPHSTVISWGTSP